MSQKLLPFDHITDHITHLKRHGGLTNPVSKHALHQAHLVAMNDECDDGDEQIARSLKLIITQVKNHQCYINPVCWGGLVELWQGLSEAVA